MGLTEREREKDRTHTEPRTQAVWLLHLLVPYPKGANSISLPRFLSLSWLNKPCYLNILVYSVSLIPVSSGRTTSLEVVTASGQFPKSATTLSRSMAILCFFWVLPRLAYDYGSSCRWQPRAVMCGWPQSPARQPWSHESSQGCVWLFH